MMAVNVADFFATLIQATLISVIMCKNFKTRYNYVTSVLCHIVGLHIQYFVINYGIFDYNLRVLVGVICFCMVGCFLFEGPILWRIALSIAEHLFMIIVDYICYYTIYPWMQVSFIEDMFISLRLLLGRNMYNNIMYLILNLMELWKNRKRGKQFVGVSMLSVVFCVCQLSFMKNIYLVNADRLTESAVLVTVFYSGIVTLVLFVVTELLDRSVSQKRKQFELEQMALEKKYQYDYYKKAYEQGEQLRDFRHDMRNQLQAVTVLLCSEDEMNRKRAQEMLDNMDRRLENN